MLLAPRLPRGHLINFKWALSFFTRSDSPPNIPAIPHTINAYGHKWKDEYDWLRSRPHEAQRVLQREADHLKLMVDKFGLSQLASQLREEVHSILPDSVEGIPECMGGYEYYVRQTRDRPLPCYFRRPRQKLTDESGKGGSSFASAPFLEESIVLDTNELAEIYGEDVSVDQVIRLLKLA